MSFGVGPMVGVSAKYHNDLDCLGYEFVRGINMVCVNHFLFIKENVIVIVTDCLSRIGYNDIGVVL